MIYPKLYAAPMMMIVSLSLALGSGIACYTLELTSYILFWLLTLCSMGLVWIFFLYLHSHKEEKSGEKLITIACYGFLVLLMAVLGYVRASHVITSYYEERPFYYGVEGDYYVQITSAPQITFTSDGLSTMAEGDVEYIKPSHLKDSTPLQGKGTIRIYIKDKPPIKVGERYIVKGVVNPFTYYEQNGILPQKQKHIHDGLVGAMYGAHLVNTYEREYDRFHSLENIYYPLWQSMHAVNLWIGKQFEMNLPASVSTLGSSLVLGAQYSTLPSNLVQLFSETGIIHILSVSGSHIALLFTLVSVLLRHCHCSKRLEFIITVCVILLYCTIVGWSPPVIRSAMMGILGGYTIMNGHQYRALQALCISGAILLLWKPLYAVDISFLLSFGSTWGIITLYPYIHQLFPPQSIYKGISLCVSAQIFIFPLELHYFHILSVLSIISNLLVGPLLDIAIIGGLCLSLCNVIITIPFLWDCLGFLLKMSVSLLWSIRLLGLWWSPSLSPFLVCVWYIGVGICYFYMALSKTIHRGMNRLRGVALLCVTLVPLGLSHIVKETHIIPISISNGPAFMAFQWGMDRSAYLYIDVRNHDLTPRTMKVCIDTLHHYGFNTWHTIWVDGEKANYKEIKKLKHLYEMKEERKKNHHSWIEVRKDKKKGLSILCKGNRNFYFKPSNHRAMEEEIVYNKSNDEIPVIGLTNGQDSILQMHHDAYQFVGWNTGHSRFDREPNVYVVGSDEWNDIEI